jgi:5-methylcytosine-specific restriction protein A
MTWDTSNRRAELPPGWSTTIVPRIKQRDGNRCTWIEHGQRCTAPADEVDHIGDRHNHDDTNLRSLCHHHHNRHTQAQAAAGRARNSRRRPSPPHPGLIRGGG